MYEGLLQSSEVTLMDCCSLKRFEKLLIICDPPSMEIGSAFFKAAQNRCQETVLVVVSPESRQGRTEFPESVIEMLRRFDVAVIPLSINLTHSQTKQVASEHKVRIASFPEITAEVFSRTMNADWRKVGVNTRKVAGRLSTAKSVRITSGSGTDFTFQIEESSVYTDDGRLSSEGGFNILPAGQVSLRPLEGTVEGVVAIDSYLSFAMGNNHEVLIFEVQQGLITSARNHKFASELEKYFNKYKETARCICHLGVGILDTAKVSGNFSEEKVALGAIHLTIGKGLPQGVASGIFPLEAIIGSCTVYVDGKLLLQDGMFVQ